MKKEILWISPYAPYDTVAHGGGKTHNFYIKYFQKSGLFDITLLSMCLKDEAAKLDLDKYGIRHQICVLDRTALQKIFRLFVSGAAYRNPFDRFGGGCLPYERAQIIKNIKKYRESGKQPDIIILHWTFSLMLFELIKKWFTKSAVIAIEEDVTFLNYERKAGGDNANARFWKKRASIMKQKELLLLSQCELIVTNNPKDTALLVKNGIRKEKIFTSAPYFDNYGNLERKAASNDVIFYGAMSRPENYLSARWFIERVMPELDPAVRFVIIGGSPDSSLSKYVSNRVILTGYVQDVSEWFSRCLCMAAPLVGGAGIKIKILEAMSAGIPVLTNDIGIEGIPAAAGQDYLFCSSPEEYVFYINRMFSGNYNTEDISENARRFIRENYNLPQKLDKLIDKIQEAGSKA